jgi:AAA family ATP:ADP antiporter
MTDASMNAPATGESSEFKSKGESTSTSTHTGKQNAKEALHEGLETEDTNDFSDTCESRGLLMPSRKRERERRDEASPQLRTEWIRPYWLGSGLFLVLFAFWLLDSLKDPILGILVGGNLERHQPPAKLFSVCTTLALVCFLEYVSHERKMQQLAEKERAREDILDAGGQWSRMNLGRTATDAPVSIEQDRVPSSIFAFIGVPYCLVFGLMAYLLQFNPAVALVESSSSEAVLDDKITSWHLVGYFFYAAIESFGSLAVATFWSFANSTLSLHDAEVYYGLIIAIAQLGAIAGSTMVTMHIWSNITLIVLACLIILLHILVMSTYSRRFQPTSDTANEEEEEQDEAEGTSTQEPTLWSGVYLMLKYNYVLLILGVSCLYEVSLTCLNYQMTLLGWSRFQDDDEGMSFTQFMGHYGQMVNIISLFLSSICFPWLIRRFGLRYTLRLFPTLLLFINCIAFGAFPGNLAVLFFSMSFLKATTYSIHDPSKEILYLPTSNAIKFKSKFWIDVVGARVAKAIGSSINTYAGSVDRSIQFASAPSLLTAAALWWVCYRAGKQFDSLVLSKTTVGMDASPRKTSEYDRLNTVHEEGEYGYDNDSGDGNDGVFENPRAAILELSPLQTK